MSDRRHFLRGLATLPLVGGSVAAQPVGSPSLARLVKEYEVAYAAMDAEHRKWDTGLSYDQTADWIGLAVICGRLRSEIALHPGSGFSDIMLKLRVFAHDNDMRSSWNDLRFKIEEQKGSAYFDDLGLALAMDMVALSAPLT